MLDFFSFAVAPASLSNVKTCCTWSKCSSGALENIKISSKYTSANWHLNFVRRPLLGESSPVQSSTQNVMHVKLQRPWQDVNSILSQSSSAISTWPYPLFASNVILLCLQTIPNCHSVQRSTINAKVKNAVFHRDEHICWCPVALGWCENVHGDHFVYLLLLELFRLRPCLVRCWVYWSAIRLLQFPLVLHRFSLSKTAISCTQKL